MNKFKMNRYRNFSLLIGSLFLVVAVLTCGHYGMGWDEITRWNSGDTKVDYYQALFLGGNTELIAAKMQRDRYPGLFDVTLSVAHGLTGIERFYLGHIWALGFGAIAMLGVWYLGRSVANTRLALAAFILLLLTPSFYGHMFQNPKDIPFAAMYTWGLLSLVYVAKEFPHVTLRGCLLMGLGIGLTMSVRLGGMVLFGYYFLVCSVWLLKSLCHPERTETVFCWLQKHLKECLCVVKAGLIATLVAYLLLMIWWPSGHQGGLFKASSTLQTLHHSAAQIPLFFRGVGMNASDAPWYYAIWMFCIKTPESILLLLLIGSGAFFSLWRRSIQTILLAVSLPWVVVVSGALFPLFYLSVTAPALHNAERHFLFIYPAVCVLAAYVWIRLVGWVKECQSTKCVWLLCALGTALLSQQVLHLIRLHPYQYVYYNSLVGGAYGSLGMYETEYWFTSTKHGLEQLDRQLPEGRASVYVAGPRQVAEYFLPERFSLANSPSEAEFAIVNSQMMMHTLFDGETIGVIEREGLPILYIYDMRH